MVYAVYAWAVGTQIANEVQTLYCSVCNIGNVLRARIHDYLQKCAPNRRLGGVDVVRSMRLSMATKRRIRWGKKPASI